MDSRRPTTACLLLAIWLAAVCAGAAPAQSDRTQPAVPLLLADDARHPRITVSWPTRDGDKVHLEGARPYRSPGDERPLGRNVSAYVALGGTRVDMGLGHPDAATIRVGFYKIDTRRPFFDRITDDGEITISLDQIVMSHPAIPLPDSALMHVQYMLSDLASCGLDPTARNLYNTASPADPLLEIVPPENTRPGILGGGPTPSPTPEPTPESTNDPAPNPDPDQRRGTVTAAVGEDGAVSFTIRFPYAILRHLQDPYQRTIPGSFFEPQHFHIEFQVIAAASPDAPPPPSAPPVSPSP